MVDELKVKESRNEQTLANQIGTKVERKLRAQSNEKRTIWLGLGMMGLIGWSVTIPTLLGAVVGLWLDKHYSVGFSWTLTMLLIGLFIGCINAWHWVTKEHHKMQQEQEENSE